MSRGGMPERTSKVWKAIEAVGLIGVLAGAVIWFAAPGLADSASGASAWRTLGLLVGVPSLSAWAIGRAGAWWCHG